MQERGVFRDGFRYRRKRVEGGDEGRRMTQKKTETKTRFGILLLILLLVLLDWISVLVC